MLPDSKYTPNKTLKARSCHIQFDLTGSCNPKTGETTLRLKQGQLNRGQRQKDGTSIERSVKFETVLRGWWTHSPKAAAMANTPIVKSLQNSGDRSFVPRVRSNSDGDTIFEQDGFFGVKGFAKPFIDHTIQLNRETLMSRNGAKIIDQTASSQQMVRQNGANTWFLEILGPADDDDEQPHRELVSLMIVPRTVVEIGIDHARQFRALAVYADNVFETEDVTEKAAWRSTKGLKSAKNASGQYAKGLYRLTTDKPQLHSSWHEKRHRLGQRHG